MQPESLRSDFITILPRWVGSATSRQEVKV